MRPADRGKDVAKPGPKTIWTEAIADHIIEQMAEHGRSLLDICRHDPGMPALRTVYDQMERDPEWRTRCARARQGLGDHWAERAAIVADKSTPETAASDRVRISTYQWLAAKMDGHRYGDRQVISGPNDGPIQVASVTVDATDLGEDQRDALRAALLAATASK